MEENSLDNIADGSNKKSKRGTFRKILLYLLLAVFVFSISIIILSQFRFFRNFALKQITALINNELIATVEIDDLTFLNLDGLKLYGVRLIADGDTLANVRELILNFNIRSVINQKVKINKIVFINPKIRLLRNSVDSLWNYDKIAYPSKDTTSSGIPNWEFLAKKIEFRNAEFLRYDSTLPYINYSMMDYDHISLNNFNMVLSADIKLNKNYYQAQIHNLTGLEEYSRLRFQNLSAKLLVSPNIISVKDFYSKVNETDLDINVEMRKFNVFDTINEPDIAKAEFKMSAKGYNIQDSVIQKFASIPIKFGNSADIKIDAYGNLNNLNVERLKLQTGNSDINIVGNLKNLLDIDNFIYEFSLDNSNFTRTDIIKVLSNLELDAIPDFGSALSKRLYVKGFLDSVYTDFDISSNLGQIVAKAGINYAYEKMRYFAEVNTNSLNLAKVLHNPELQSNINGTLYFKGVGTDTDNLEAFLIAKLNSSSYQDIKFDELITNINIKERIVRLDTLRFKPNTSLDSLDSNTYNDDEFIDITGSIGIDNIEQPDFDLIFNFESVNLKKLLNIQTLPNYFTANFGVKIHGLSLDSLKGDFSSYVTGLSFDDRAFFPFKMDIKINQEDNAQKELIINSDLFDFNLSGKFNLDELINTVIYQGQHTASYILDKIYSFNPTSIESVDSLKISMPNMSKFPQMDAVLKLKVSDISPVNIFLDSISLYSDIELNTSIKTTDNSSRIIIDSLKLVFFEVNSKQFRLQTTGLSFSGELKTSLIDSTAKIDLFELNFDKHADFKFNDVSFDSSKINVKFADDVVNYFIDFNLNKILNFHTLGNISISDSLLVINSDSTRFGYENFFFWKSLENLNLHLSEGTIDVKNFNFSRENGESIKLSGLIKDDIAKDLVLELYHIPVTEYMQNSIPEFNKRFPGMIVNVDTVKVRVNGSLDKPRVITSIQSDSIVFNNYKIGQLNGRLIHNQTYMHGFFDITTPFLNNKKTLNIDVNYLPIYLGLSNEYPFFDSTKTLDIRLKAMGLPMDLLLPFAPGLSELSGYTDATIIVEGSLDKGLSYSGSAQSEKCRLKIENTNIYYNADLNIDFNKDKITLKKVSLRNIPEDVRFGRIGKAEVTGTIELLGFDIGELDLTISADRLLAMSDATMVTMPDLYGDFILTTGENPLRFYGTLEKPNLDGNANIIFAHLKMPLEQKRQAVRTYLTYQTIGNKVRIQSTTKRDTLETKKNNDQGLAPSIADLINYNLSAKILGQFIVEMDMNLIGSMYAVIATPDRSQTLRYEKKREWIDGKLFGEVIVKDQSTIKSWKQFTTGGKITFPTGSIENPSLDLSATHIGTMSDNNGRKQFIVKMFITGYKEDPKVKFTYFIDGEEASGSQEQINEDALYLLVTGRTKVGNTGNINTSLLNEGFASGVSNFATKALSDLLMGTGVIQSAEFDFQGGSMNLEDATLRLSGQLYGGISWTIGGTVSDLSSNNQITIDIPASEFLSNPFWSNFVVQLSKASNNNVLANSQDAKNWEVKIKLGNSW
ncbi:hypothetical protein MASR1M45_04390 [Candidatus Kapaibacterium sp.]